MEFIKFKKPVTREEREPILKTFADYQHPHLAHNGQLENWEIYVNPANAKRVAENLAKKAKKREEAKARRLSANAAAVKAAKKQD